MSAGIIIGIVVVVLVIIVIIWAISAYNKLVRLRNVVEESWKQIDTELQRRHDLIPNLVETVKGYAAHEKSTFEEVTAARAGAAAPGQSPAQQAESENILTQAIGRLFAVAEAYPQLQASTQFQQLQLELTSTEDRIASARRYYNANVRTFNTAIQSVPSNIIAGMFHFKTAEYFELENQEARQAPTVSF